MTNPGRIESSRPLASRHRRESRLSGRTGKVELQRALEPRHNVAENHGARDINAQPLCGSGYDPIPLGQSVKGKHGTLDPTPFAPLAA